MELKKVVVILFILLGGVLYYHFQTTQEFIPVDVIRVIDGDTVELASGQKVRLLGINTPEKNQPFYEEAKQFLETQTTQNTYLEQKSVDRYGRILGYLYQGNKLINELIVSQGFAHLYYYDIDNHYDEIKKTENKARENQIGIWQESPYASCLVLVELDYYDKGDENETLTLQNNCGMPLEVIIKDDATHIYKETIQQGIFTKIFKNIFNDDKDSLYIWDKEGKLIIFYRYH